MDQKGFTLIELIMVIVILGILAVTAIPKYVDMKTEAAEAQADGVLGAAKAACSINFAANLVGKTTTDIPAYDGTNCADGLITAVAQTGGAANQAGTCLLNAIDGTPSGWTASADTITATINSVTYIITVTTNEDADNAAIVGKSW